MKNQVIGIGTKNKTKCDLRFTNLTSRIREGKYINIQETYVIQTIKRPRV